MLLILGCSRPLDSKVSDNFINEISVVDEAFPSKFVGYNLYVKTNENLIFVSNVNFLHLIYKDFYQQRFKDFRSFLLAIFKNNFELKAQEIKGYEYGIFKPDEEILALSAESISYKYLIKTQQAEKFYFNDQNESYERKQTIFYKMFLEGYLISFDDYGASFIIEKYSSN